MNDANLRPFGVGHRLTPWGAHLLALHTSEFALEATAVSYLEAGLIAGEACLWITESETPAERVRQAAHRRGSALARFVNTPMLAAVSLGEWYFTDGRLDVDRVAERWQAFIDAAWRKGYVGARAFVEVWSKGRHRDEFLAHDCAGAGILKSLPVLVTCAYAHGSISGDLLRRLRRAHDSVLTASETATTLHDGYGDPRGAVAPDSR